MNWHLIAHKNSLKYGQAKAWWPLITHYYPIKLTFDGLYLLTITWFNSRLMASIYSLSYDLTHVWWPLFTHYYMIELTFDDLWLLTIIWLNSRLMASNWCVACCACWRVFSNSLLSCSTREPDCWLANWLAPSSCWRRLHFDFHLQQHI